MKTAKHFLLALMLILSLGLALVACSSVDTSGDVTAETTGTDVETPTEELTGAPETPTEEITEGMTQDITEAPTEESDTEEPIMDGYAYKHVVVIGVDGAGAFFRDADTPNLDAIFAEGAVTYDVLTSNPTISAQCWGSMLHGVVPTLHGLTNAIVENTPYDTDSSFPSIFRVIREQMPEATLASLCNWNPINVGIVEDGLGVYKFGGVGDQAIMNEACSYVRQHQPTFLFIQLDEADGAGHGNGYGTAAHLAKIHEQDAMIQQLYQVYEKLGILEDTLFIVTADHGGNGTSHGGWSDAEKYVMFAATGKTVETGVIGEMEVRDTAAVVIHALGLEAPTTWSARVPSGLFKGFTAGERPEYSNPDSERYHESVPTPAKGSEGYITNFITDKALKTYLTFDGDITDACGAPTEQGGKLYFVDGYFGQGVELSDGNIRIPDYDPAKESFTVSMWISTQGSTGDPPLLSNKDWNKGINKGYVLSFWGDAGKIRFNVGDGTNRMDDDHPFPEDYYEGWMHVLFIVDREAGEIRFSYDFGPMTTAVIPDSLKDDSFKGLSQLCIGSDGTGEYKYRLSAVMDEFMMFEGAFTVEDMVKLAAYYGKEAHPDSIRNRPSVATPTKGSEGYITNFITDKTLKTYLTFDGEAVDACGNATVTEKGTVVYGEGFFGQAANMGNGYVSLTDYQPGTDSFTVALWFKTSGVVADPALFSNKDWTSGNNPGYVLSLRDTHDLKFNVGDGTNRADKEFPLPGDYRVGWVHVVLVVDREAEVIKLSYDFGKFQTLALPDSLKGDSFNAYAVLNIGQDGTGVCSPVCTASIDEFMLFDGVLDEEDVAALAAYYGV